MGLECVACFKWCGQKVDDPYKLRAGMLLISVSRLSAFDRAMDEVEAFTWPYLDHPCKGSL